MSALAQELIAENIAKHERGEDASYLDLGRCGLTQLPEELGQCVWLEVLVLSNEWVDSENLQWEESKNKGVNNRLEAFPPEIGQLSNLRKLILAGDYPYGWPLNDGKSLNGLTQLTYLDISYCKFDDWHFLEKMGSLTELYIRGIQIADAYFLEKLTNLAVLDISDNKLEDGHGLSGLINLSRLHISGNKIKDEHELGNLTNLSLLILGGNEVSDGRFLAKLTQLKGLNLGDNKIKDWDVLTLLKGLTYLNINGNKIKQINFLRELVSLSRLDIGNNFISEGAPLANLSGLVSLNLGYNEIANINFLVGLTGLCYLDLNNNKIKELLPLEKLRRLTYLDLNFNNIKDIQALSSLSGIENLSLSRNQITDVKPLKGLKKIKILNLGNNQITNMKALLPLLKDTLQVSIQAASNAINLHNNPLTTPPPEIVEQGNAAILEYFRQKEIAGIKPLLEAKMVLLGDGRAGKTSLACRMLGKELPRQEDRTLGVDIEIGAYRFPVEEGEFVLHIWDFAGQDKYKPLHQFFYTEGAVYVMVADSGDATTDFADWFETAEMFGGGGSPLLVVLNEFREGMGRGAFDEEKWRKQFPKLIKEVRLVNLLSQEGFPALEKDIRHLADQLPQSRSDYPANWANIRAELERRREENYISLPDYLKICHQFELPERESALILSGVLHRIGVCLHYQKSDLLRQHVILKNEWATAAVYKILEDRIVAEEKQGFFDWSDLRRIWSDDTYCDMQPQLLELMCEFKMAYSLPGGREFVVPPLLSNSPPQDWDFPAGETIEVFVEYEFLPKALMTQFIVSRHLDIDREQRLVWREGLVLRWSEDTLAQVSKIKSQGRDAFLIQVMGTDRRGLLTAILKTLRDLHAEYRGIRVHEIVPCPCEACRTKKNPQHYFDFKNLANRLEKGRRIVECDQSLEEVDLLKILGDLLLFERLNIGERLILKEPKTEQNADLSTSIRNLIAQSELREALELLAAKAPSIEVTLLQQRFSKLESEERMGTWSIEERLLEHNRIGKAILGFVEGKC